MPTKLLIDDVINICLDKGFEFLDSNYINNDHRHSFRCIIDNQVYDNTFKSICAGYGLRCCGIRKKKEALTYSLYEVCEISKNNGFIFLDDNYLGCKFKHNFNCTRHNQVYKSTFQSVVTGKGLRCCMVDSNRINNKINSLIFVGKNHPNWNNDLTDEERRIHRSISGYQKWRKDVFLRDAYQCQCCGSISNIQAHHLQSYKENHQLRIDINNGITLCLKCHNLLHSIYGRGNTTLLQIQLLGI